MAVTIRSLINNPELQRVAGETARILAESNFSLEKVYSAQFDEYRALHTGVE